MTTARLDAFRRLALDSALVEIARRLQGSAVPVLLLKGPAFARWLYDDPRERSYNDIDLLVSPDTFEAAKRALSTLGFESLPKNSMPPNEQLDPHHEEWIRPGTLPLAVELHHTIWGVTAPPSLFWERLADGAEPIEVAGARVDAPSEVGSAMIVALHAADHAGTPRSSTRGPRTSQPPRGRVNPNRGGRFAGRDLRQAIERVNFETWRAAAALADELGAGALFAYGLRLDPKGRTIADRLGLGDGAPRNLRLRAVGTPATARGIESLLATPGIGPRANLLARELAPSPAFMRQWSAIARRGRRGLVFAYLWRPFWLTIMLPRGLRAWFQAGGLHPLRSGDGGPRRDR